MLYRSQAKHHICCCLTVVPESAAGTQEEQFLSYSHLSMGQAHSAPRVSLFHSCKTQHSPLLGVQQLIISGQLVQTPSLSSAYSPAAAGLCKHLYSCSSCVQADLYAKWGLGRASSSMLFLEPNTGWVVGVSFNWALARSEPLRDRNEMLLPLTYLGLDIKQTDTCTRASLSTYSPAYTGLTASLAATVLQGELLSAKSKGEGEGCHLGQHVRYYSGAELFVQRSWET